VSRCGVGSPSTGAVVSSPIFQRPLAHSHASAPAVAGAPTGTDGANVKVPVTVTGEATVGPRFSPIEAPPTARKAMSATRSTSKPRKRRRRMSAMMKTKTSTSTSACQVPMVRYTSATGNK